MKSNNKKYSIALSIFIFCAFIISLFALFSMSTMSLYPSWSMYKGGSKELKIITQEHDHYHIWQGNVRNPKLDLGLEFETVEFSTEGSSILRGWFIPGHGINIKKVIIAAHGGGSDRRSFLRHLPIFNTPGYSVLLFDSREHGISDGDNLGVSFGVREHQDLIHAAKYVRQEKGAEKVALIGTSQGAVASILAIKSDEIDAVIAENPFESIESLFENTKYNGNNLPPWLMRALAKIVMWRIGGLKTPSAIEVLKGNHKPIFIMHGTGDRLVPYQQSKNLFDVTLGIKNIWIAKNAEHSKLYNLYPDEYKKKVQEFLDANL